MPLPGTHVIHPGWSRHHQPTATGGMHAACVITDPDRATPVAWDDESGTYAPAEPHYVVPAPEGEAGWPCRVQALTSDEETEQGGQQSGTRDYLVQLHDPDLATLPDLEVGHVIEVTAAANDPHLVGLALTIRDVQHGSERFTRDVVATHNQQPPTT